METKRPGRGIMNAPCETSGAISRLCGAILPWVAGLLTVCAIWSAQAQTSGQDKADISRVEAYLNGIRSLQGTFLQVAADGSLSEGKIYLRRPGRFRFEYTPPSPILIVADGLFVVFHDRELGQTERMLLTTTPLSVLVREEVRFSNGIEVRGVSRSAGILRILTRDPARPEEGELTLVFADQPLALRQWQVRDARGQVTTVTLSGLEFNQPLPNRLFVFTDPAPGDDRRNPAR